MEKPTKKKLRQMLTTLTVQQKVSHPPVVIEKNINAKIKRILTNEGMQLLNQEINNIVEQQKINMKSNSKFFEIKDFNQMKRNLKIYGKNKTDYRVQKIIKIGQEKPQQKALKSIVKVHEDKFTIAKEHNIKLSQKIDAIIQEQNIMVMKNASRKHMQSKLQAPLVKQLRRYNSTHVIGRTERDCSIKTRDHTRGSSWTQRKVQFEGLTVQEEKPMQKYRRKKGPELTVRDSSEEKSNRQSLQILPGIQKKQLSRFSSIKEQTKRISSGHPTRRLKRKAIEYN